MGIGTSLFLVAVGAILYFAVNADVPGLEISTVGVILMVVGVVGRMISLFLLSSWRRRPVDRPPDRYRCQPPISEGDDCDAGLGPESGLDRRRGLLAQQRRRGGVR